MVVKGQVTLVPRVALRATMMHMMFGRPRLGRRRLSVTWRKSRMLLEIEYENKPNTSAERP